MVNPGKGIALSEVCDRHKADTALMLPNSFLALSPLPGYNGP